MDLLGNSTWDRVILGFFRGHILKKLDFFQKIAIWAHCALVMLVTARWYAGGSKGEQFAGHGPPQTKDLSD